MSSRREKVIDRVRYHTKLRAANVAKKKISLDFLIENFAILKRKLRTILRANRNLAKELASTKTDLAIYKKEAIRQLDIANIYIPRAKAWIDESSRSMQQAMSKHIRAVGLMEEIVKPHPRLSLVPQDSTLLEEEADGETRPPPRPPGSRFPEPLGVSAIPEVDEPEEGSDVPEHLLRKALENGAVTRRGWTFRDRRPPSDARVPLESTPACSPEPRSSRSPCPSLAEGDDSCAESCWRTTERSAGKGKPSLASAGPRDGCELGQEERHRLLEHREPAWESFRTSFFDGTMRRSPGGNRTRLEEIRRRLSFGELPKRPSVEGDGSADSESMTGSRNTSTDDRRSLDAGRRGRRASRVVSYKEPRLNKKLRRP